MRTRLNMIIVAFLAILLVMMLVVIRDAGPRPRQAAPALAAVGTMQFAAEPEPASSPVSPVATDAPEVAVVATTAADDDKSKYTAQWGDTVSNLAAELPGGNLKVNRAAVINANPALQADPDRLIAGQTYEIPANAAVPAPVAAPAPAPAVGAARTAAAVTAEAPDAGTHQLRYTARAGDNVSVLAAALLGDDSKANRDAIVAANHSLQVNPDRVIDGRTYRIPVGQSQPLSAAATPAADATGDAARPAAARVGAEPDADDVVEASAARDLRYTAQPGDTVSTLAVALLGSDTPANRAAIVDNNKSLVKDADHVVAGQTYWITAPASATR